MSGGTDTLKPLARLLQLALRLGTGQAVTSGYIRERYGVSPATAKRDLVRLECALPVIVEGVRCEQKVLRMRDGPRFTPLFNAACT